MVTSAVLEVDLHTHAHTDRRIASSIIVRYFHFSSLQLVAFNIAVTDAISRAQSDDHYCVAYDKSINNSSLYNDTYDL